MQLNQIDSIGGMDVNLITVLVLLVLTSLVCLLILLADRTPANRIS